MSGRSALQIGIVGGILGGKPQCFVPELLKMRIPGGRSRNFHDVFYDCLDCCHLN